jgi:hypothetical protein
MNAEHIEDYDDDEIGCVNCDNGWKHGCCDDLCIGCTDEAIDCFSPVPCRECNPKGLIAYY